MQKNKLLIIVFFTLLVVINSAGIFPVSIEKAVQKQGWKNAFLTVGLENDSALLFMEEEKGEIRLASAYKGIFGWKIVDDSGLLSVSEDVEGFSGTEGSIKIKSNKKLHYFMGIIVDKNIDNMTFKLDEETKERTLYRTITQNGTRIYYTTLDKELDEVTYIAYNHLDQIIYSKP
ncbi:hypothetical protein ACFSTA_18500 [Ornithinibacillus salinisoli]|uniref:DUF4340 domain-containing protein n=1 Tax=Ornithinibacillus salinisoli TaxID=1848459 RepID=A0ABW4W1J0_9BACI